MAATFASVGDKPYYIVGSQKMTITDATLDSSYVTAGEPVTAANLGLNYVDHAEAQIKANVNATDGSAVADYVESTNVTGLIKVYDDVAEVGSGDDLSGMTVRITAYGS